MLPPDPSDDLQSYFQMCDSVTGLGMAPPDSLYGFEDPFLSLNMSPFDELTGNQQQQQQQQQQSSTLPSKASTSAGTPLEGTLLMPSGLHAHQQKPLMMGRPPDSTMPYGDFPLLGIQPSMIQPDIPKAPLRQTDRASPSSSARPTAGDQRTKASDAASQGSPEKSILGSDSPAISHGTPSSTMSIDLPRRDAHMASEQRRRAIMGQCFERLKQLLPPQEYRKPSKANILQAVVNYLETLQRLERTLRLRIQSLQQENAVLKQHVHGGGTSFGMGGASLGTHSRASTLDTNHPPIAPK